MTNEMLKFLELYDKTNHKTHGKFKLSHFYIGKLLQCAIDTDKYGNTYYRRLTTCIRQNLFVGKDYIIEPKVKNQQGQRTWFVTKEALFVLALLLRGGKRFRGEMTCDERLQRDHRKYNTQLVRQTLVSPAQKRIPARPTLGLPISVQKEVLSG